MGRSEVRILDLASMTQTLRSAQNGKGKIIISDTLSEKIHNKAVLK